MDYIVLPRDYLDNGKERSGQIDEKRVENIIMYWSNIAKGLGRQVRNSERITAKDLAVTITA